MFVSMLAHMQAVLSVLSSPGVRLLLLACYVMVSSWLLLAAPIYQPRQHVLRRTGPNA